MKNRVYIKALFFASFALLTSTGFSQKNNENLVENGSFESISGKMRKLGGIEAATGWLTPTGVPADLYSSGTKTPEISVPTNANGHEKPYDGRNYAGIVAYSYNDKVPRTYLMSKLIEPLKKGQKYCVTFYASLSENSKYATSSIGANLTGKPYSSGGKVSIIDNMDIKRGDKKILSGFFGWDKICNVYTAKGGEKYITVGNFLNNNEVGYEKMRTPKDFKGTQQVAAYYYIDDVTVKLISDITECDCSVQNEDDIVSTLIFQKVTEITNKMTDQQAVEAYTAFFGYGSTELTSAGKAALDDVAKLMQKNQTFRLEIQGHMDKTEQARSEENTALQGLDVARAESAKAYLVEEAKVFAHRISVAGKGDSVVNENDISDADDDEMVDAKSRRVTFEVK